MTRDVYITISGTQLEEDGGEAVTELKVRGQYYEREGSRYLLYEEQDSETGEVTRNTLKIKDYTLEIYRSGPLHSRMVFEAGATHRTSYITPYGVLQLEIHTKALRSFWGENGGTVQAEYRLTSGNDVLSENRLFIKILSEKP